MKRTPWLVALLSLLLTHFSFAGTSAQDETTVFLPLLMTTPPQLAHIAGPLLVDGEQERIYTQAEVYGSLRTAVLQTGDGSLLDSFASVFTFWKRAPCASCPRAPSCRVSLRHCRSPLTPQFLELHVR